jgi:hypothetical protein
MSVATANAEAALARIDDGVEQPGDRLLAAAFEEYCRHEWLVFADREHAAREATELARACPICMPGGSGPECDSCYTAHDYAVARSADV